MAQRRDPRRVKTLPQSASRPWHPRGDATQAYIWHLASLVLYPPPCGYRGPFPSHSCPFLPRIEASVSAAIVRAAKHLVLQILGHYRHGAHPLDELDIDAGRALAHEAEEPRHPLEQHWLHRSLEGLVAVVQLEDDIEQEGERLPPGRPREKSARLPRPGAEEALERADAEGDHLFQLVLGQQLRREDEVQGLAGQRLDQVREAVRIEQYAPRLRSDPLAPRALSLAELCQFGALPVLRLADGLIQLDGNPGEPGRLGRSLVQGRKGELQDCRTEVE
mmetsp:Transcript_34464/g.101255  ORF Transcript_34464/g.101255 Transcript_34464/m.101255 type:complete len:277 (+) Transcript_34464:335-1165(+)